MRNYIQITLVLFLSILITSCTGSKETDKFKEIEEPKEEIIESKPEKSDFDPYFIDSEGITSKFGPKSITRNMLLDKRGDVWLATWEGIIRYDGNVFTNFTNKEGLRRFHAFAILEDSKGNLWFATIGAGVYYFDGKTFTNFTSKDGLGSDRATNIYEDKSGHIWVGSEGGLSRFYPEGIDGKLFHNFTTVDGLPHNDVNSIVQDRSGKYWIGTRGDACIYDPSAKVSEGEKAFTLLLNNTRPFNNIRSIIEDSKGNIWLDGGSGFWRYNPAMHFGVASNGFTKFSKKFTGYIYEDRKGNVWTSSEGEDRMHWVISRFDESTLGNKNVIPIEIKTKKGMFFGIVEDRDENIWFGDLEGVTRYDGEIFTSFRDE